ncbi:MAG: hypothetical protein ACU0CC_01120 [Sagittula sp.]|jgi:hypothetical protein|uniref:hypothetical protein n=1 Tax=unclassified Sagittula TaxID=2624628 RepID=UPI0024C2569D|nr:hypothetical protein [Sagittula sp. MA-2]WHZ35513.1 hypothetical protein QNI11_00565 [Sagittula sp. MA-2]
MPSYAHRRSPVYYWHPTRWIKSVEAHVPHKVLRDMINRVRFGAVVPPSDSAIYVDPAEVRFEYTGGARLRLRRHDSARVVGGDWDRHRSEIGETIRMKSCRMRFFEGADWEDTPMYQRMLRQIGEGKKPDGCASVEDLRRRFAGIDLLKARTLAEGRFLNREELPENFRREHGGILLHVARDGTLLRSGGAGHRFAIARLLNLPEIPAQIGAIHREAVDNGVLASLRRTSRLA